MQDLTALFGTDGAARYLDLVASSYRQPCWELLALNENGTTAMDITARLQRAAVEFTDEVGVSQKATFVFGNEDGYFDPYTGSPQSGLFVQGRILQYRKGLVDPVDGTRYLLPAYWGRIIRARFGYSDSGDVIAEMTLGDALKDAVRQKYTSPAYENTEANLIGVDLLKRFGKFTDGRIQLAEVGHLYPFVQFPDFGLLDMLKTLYDPFLYWVRADESGNVTSGPRLGSALSGFSSVLGYPDQPDAPPEEAVSFVFPDFPGVDTAEEEIQDYDGVYNQVRVLGKASASLQSLGPSQILSGVQNSTIGARDTLKKQYSFTDQVGDPKNAVVAQNVIVEFAYSTNHTIDTTPRFVYLSQLKWRGAWSASTTYAIGDAVSYSGSQYAANKGADSTHPPSDTEYWSEVRFAGPYVQATDLFNETSHLIGYIAITSLTASYIVLDVEGRQYSEGGPVRVRHHGGFDYYFNIYGQPVLSNSKALTAYADYNSFSVTGEELVEAFGDHLTYQAANAPFGMATPVEVFINGVSQGQIAVDQTVLTGETRFAVDFERGRIVLQDLAYQDWTPDRNSTPGRFSSGTSIDQASGVTFDRTQLPVPTPPEVFTRFRKGDATYILPGLTIGQGYDIRFNFADPINNREKQRVFSVYVQGQKLIEGLDIVEKTGGASIAYQEEITGIAPDISGNITIKVTQHDPASGNLLPECSSDGNGGGSALGEALVFGIEVILPQGQGAPPYAINCGGDAITPTPPTVTCNYGFSPVQQTFGAQVYEINDPLIGSQEACQSVADFWVNFFAWQRNRQTFAHASVSHLQPGDLVKFYQPKTRVDFWAYLQAVSRDATQGGGDTDTFRTLLIYALKRT